MQRLGDLEAGEHVLDQSADDRPFWDSLAEAVHVLAPHDAVADERVVALRALRRTVIGGHLLLLLPTRWQTQPGWHM